MCSRVHRTPVLLWPRSIQYANYKPTPPSGNLLSLQCVPNEAVALCILRLFSGLNFLFFNLLCGPKVTLLSGHIIPLYSLKVYDFVQCRSPAKGQQRRLLYQCQTDRLLRAPHQPFPHEYPQNCRETTTLLAMAPVG